MTVGNQQTWSPQHRGYFKVSVDAAANADKQIPGLEAVIQDETENVIAAAINPSKFYGDVSFVEAEAMEWGMQA